MSSLFLTMPGSERSYKINLQMRPRPVLAALLGFLYGGVIVFAQDDVIPNAPTASSSGKGGGSMSSRSSGRSSSRKGSNTFGTFVEDFRIVSELTITPAQEVGKFLDSKSRAIKSIRPFLDQVLDELPDELVELLGGRDNDEFYLKQMMFRPELGSSDQNERLLIDFSNPDCVTGLVDFVSSLAGAFLQAIGLGSTANVVGNSIARRLTGSSAFRQRVGQAFVDGGSTRDSVLQTATEIVSSLSMDALLKDITEAYDDFWELLLLGGSIAVNVASIFVAFTSPLGVALFFASKGFAINNAVQSGITFSMCDETDEPTSQPTSRPTNSPTDAPTAFPTHVPTSLPTNQPSISATPTTMRPTESPTQPKPSPQPSDRPPPSSSCRATSDPHFFTWRGRFSFQGACDVIFVQTEDIEIQLRLSFQDAQRRFSFVSSVAIAVGTDVLQVNSDRSSLINGVQAAAGTSVLGELFPVEISGSSVEVSLSGGQMIRVSFYRDTINLDVVGHESTFGQSVGFAGSFFNQATPDRNGVALMSPTPQEIADEWKVNTSVGDADLFDTESMYSMQTFCEPPLPFSTTSQQREAAEAACSDLADPQTIQDCTFDILATNGDETWAMNPGFTEPLVELEDVCLGTNTADCSDLGGTCVWRCNNMNFDCIPNLCNGGADDFDVVSSPEFEDGCSCALPLGTATSLPSSSPSYAPSSSPTGGKRRSGSSKGSRSSSKSSNSRR